MSCCVNCCTYMARMIAVAAALRNRQLDRTQASLDMGVIYSIPRLIATPIPTFSVMRIWTFHITVHGSRASETSISAAQTALRQRPY